MRRIAFFLLAVTLFLFTAGAAGTHYMASVQITQVVQKEDTVFVYYDVLSDDKEPIKGATNCNTTVRIGNDDLTVKNIEQHDETRDGCCYLFLIDTSSGAFGGQIKLLQKTLSNWVKDMSVLDYVAILTFGNTVSPQTETFTNNKTDLLNKIAKLKLSGSQSVLYQAVGEAVDFANRPGEQFPNKRVVVLFSDGVNLAPKNAADTQSSALDSIGSGGLPFYIFGYENPSKKDDYNHLTDMAEISDGNLEKCKPADLVPKGRALYERIQFSCVASVALESSTPVDTEMPLEISLRKDDTTVTAKTNVMLAPFAADVEPGGESPAPPDAAPAEQSPEPAQSTVALPVAPDVQPEQPADDSTVWPFVAIGGGVCLLAMAIVLVLLRVRRRGDTNAMPKEPIDNSKPKQKSGPIHIDKGANEPVEANGSKPPQTDSPAIDKKIETPVPGISISRLSADASAVNTHRDTTDTPSGNATADPSEKSSDNALPTAGDAVTVVLDAPNILRLYDEAGTAVLKKPVYTLHLTSCADRSQEYSANITTSVSVGRKRLENQIVIEDPCISKMHCTFHLTDGTLRVLDADSLNRTWLSHNNSAIPVGTKEPVTVENGDTITLGKAKFVVTLVYNDARQ